MTAANINVYWTRSHGSLSLYLFFNRHVEPVDLKRCQRFFAKVLDEVFTKQDFTLKIIEFDHGYVLPRNYERFPYRLEARAALLRGEITAAQLHEFGELLLRELNSIRGYSAVHSRHPRPPQD